MERDEAGYSTTNGLFAIIEGMRRLPGRKSIILFSEGIALPPAVQRLFIGVIDAANRANVSIYTMDAAGLRAESEQAKIRDQVNKAGAGGGGILAGGSGGGALTQSLENNEDVLRQDPRNSLGALARDTGGCVRQHQQPASGVRSRRERSAQLLPGGLHLHERQAATEDSAPSTST